MNAHALQSIRVVTWDDSLATSVAGYHLVLAGCEVVIVEPEEGCWLRAVPSSPSGENVLWSTYGRGKCSVIADRVDAEALAQYADITLLSQLTRSADARVASEHRIVIDTDMVGAPDLFIQARTGMLPYLGMSGHEPVRCGFEVASFSVGVAAAQAALAAVVKRDSDGIGVSVSVSGERVVANLIGNQIVGRSYPDEEVSFAAYHRTGCQHGFHASDGWIEIVFFRDNGGWQRFCESLGAVQLAIDGRFSSYASRSANKAELEDELAPLLESRTAEDVIHMVRQFGGFVVPKLSPAEAVASDQSRATSMVADMLGGGLLKAPWTIGGDRQEAGPVPELGRDTASIRGSWGLD